MTGVMLRLSALLGLADVPELKSNLETSGAGLSVWNPALIPGVLEKPVVVGKLVTVVGMLVMVVEMLVKVVGMRVTVVGKLVIEVASPPRSTSSSAPKDGVASVFIASVVSV